MIVKKCNFLKIDKYKKFGKTNIIQTHESYAISIDQSNESLKLVVFL